MDDLAPLVRVKRLLSENRADGRAREENIAVQASRAPGTAADSRSNVTQ
jgi:hypothetical protein